MCHSMEQDVSEMFTALSFKYAKQEIKVYFKI